MMVKKFLAGSIGTNCYLGVNEDTKEAVLVDPAECTDELKECVRKEGLRIAAVLLTHGHYDHIMGLNDVKSLYGDVPVYIHEKDVPMLTDETLNLSAYLGMGYSYTGKVVPVRDGQTLTLAGYEILVFHTPGHTPGGACYYVASEKVLFSGDTLFQTSVGRTDFPGGSMEQLVEAVKEKLFVLPEDTHVYPGHMGTTTIGDEKAYNPFVA